MSSVSQFFVLSPRGDCIISRNCELRPHALTATHARLVLGVLWEPVLLHGSGAARHTHALWWCLRQLGDSRVARELARRRRRSCGHGRQGGAEHTGCVLISMKRSAARLRRGGTLYRIASAHAAHECRLATLNSDCCTCAPDRPRAPYAAVRGDVPRDTSEVFFRKVKFWTKEAGLSEPPPVFVSRGGQAWSVCAPRGGPAPLRHASLTLWLAPCPPRVAPPSVRAERGRHQLPVHQEGLAVLCGHYQGARAARQPPH
jgi:hypothetical protein